MTTDNKKLVQAIDMIYWAMHDTNVAGRSARLENARRCLRKLFAFDEEQITEAWSLAAALNFVTKEEADEMCHHWSSPC
jgi:hypothetical protein